MTKTVDDRLRAALGDLAAMARRRDEERKRADENWAEVQRVASHLSLEKKAHDRTASLCLSGDCEGASDWKRMCRSAERELAELRERVQYLAENADTADHRRRLRMALGDRDQ